MKKTQIISFVRSLVLLPIMTVTLGGVPSAGLVSITPSQFIAQADAASQPDPILVKEGAAIDAYFKAHNMPLEGTGIKMAQAASDNGIDWRLLPAISVRESTGGKNDCNSVKNNPFGWGSCKIGFKTIDDAINTVASNLGGNNPNTAMHYDNKTTKQILHAYNPPSIVPHYAEQVMSFMNDIGPADITNSPNATT